MNKRIILCACLVIIVGLTTSCGQEKVESISSIDIISDAKTDSYNSANQLTEASDLIVRVTKKDDKNILTNSAIGQLVDGHTESTVIVEKIYKNTTDEKIRVNDEINVCEIQYTYKDDETNRNITCHVNGYQKMIKDDEYILYMNYSEGDKWFYPVAGVFGKMPLTKGENIIIDSNKIKTLNGISSLSMNDEITTILQKIHEETLQLYFN